MAFTTKRKRDGWVIVWHDATRGAGRLGRRETYCVGGNHAEAFDAAAMPPSQRAALATGASNSAQRDALCRAYDLLEVARLRDAERVRATGSAPTFDMPAAALLNAFESLIRYRVGLGDGARQAPPADLGWRHSVAERALRQSTGREVLRTLTYFRCAIPPSLTTGAMTGEHVRRFLADTRAEHGWSAATVNRQRSYLSGLFGALTGKAAKRLFRSDPAAWFTDDAAKLPEPHHEIVTYDAADVTAFLTEAERRSDPTRRVRMVTRRRLGRIETYEQPDSEPPAPVLSWALAFACLGVRRAEAEGLRWTDVDLTHGVVRVHSTKTGTVRHVPLIGDPTGNVAPAFVAVLRAWRKQRPDDVFVMPSAAGAPCFPKGAWESTARAAGVDVTPQGLRRTFESTLAAIGFPSGLAAFWLGHSVKVAESNYRAYRPGRLPGATVDAALGLTPFLDRETKAAQSTTELRLVPRPSAAAGA